ncbi:NlpC/P60 family protein [Pantoea agglomerans]|uniref:NlpC/P60 family protein n=1 Tax=Enterobacter agglomerans TaxID=549 RepID=UPI003C7A6223
MRKSEFIERVTGVPWADRACTFEAMDCWGLVVLYYRHVLGIEIHHTEDYESGRDFMTCFQEEAMFWDDTEIFRDGCIFIAYYGAQPVHVGLTVDGMALHSRGECGHVRADSIRTIKKLFTRLEFKTYAGHSDSARTGAA